MIVTPRPKNRKLASPSMAQRVEKDLRERIIGGAFRPGAMLPSRRQLATEYGVALLTVEQAMKNLVADGLLRAENGRGTFVAYSETSIPSPQREVQTAQPALLTTESGRAHDMGPSSLKAVMAPTVGIVAALYLINEEHLALNNFWVRLLVHSMEKEFSDEGKTTHFFNRVTDADTHLIPLTDAVCSAVASGVDALAIIAFGHDPQEVDRSLAQLGRSDLPTVCITSGDLRRPVPFVSLDNHSAGYHAAEHLLAAGCRDFLFVAPFESEWVRERLEGVRAAVEHAGLNAEDAVRVSPPFVGAWVQEQDPEVPGYEAAARAFREGVAGLGIICANDGVAIGFIHAASESGLVPGADFALVSFDDHPGARNLGLTTMRPPMEAMGREASRMLLQIMSGKQVPLRVRMQWELIPRASARATHALRRTEPSILD